MIPLQIKAIAGAVLAVILFGAGWTVCKWRYEALQAAQLKAVADAYQSQVLAREASEKKLQEVTDRYDAIKDIPDPATVGVAHRLLIAAAGGCTVPEARTVAGGAQAPAAQSLGPSRVERSLGAYIKACSADAAQMIPMVELAP